MLGIGVRLSDVVKALHSMESIGVGEDRLCCKYQPTRKMSRLKLPLVIGYVMGDGELD